MITPLIGLILFPIIVFSIGKIITDNVLLYLYPGVFLALLSIGMSPQGYQSTSQEILSVAIGVGITLVIYLIVGAILGWIYGKIKQRKSQNIQK